MLKEIATLLYIFLLTNSFFSQIEDKLVGKWVFKDIYNKELLDEKTLYDIESSDLDNMFFRLNSDGTYSSYAFKNTTEGEWILTEGEESFVLKTDITSLLVQILKIEDDELVLRVGEGEFLFSREQIN